MEAEPIAGGGTASEPVGQAEPVGEVVRDLVPQHLRRAVQRGDERGVLRGMDRGVVEDGAREERDGLPLGEPPVARRRVRS